MAGNNNSSSGGFDPLSLLSSGVSGLFGFLGAGKQADAAEQAAQLQAQTAKEQMNLESATAQQALQYAHGQSQLSLDQYNAQQKRLQPYRNLGLFALGQGPQNAPADLQLPPLPGLGTPVTNLNTGIAPPDDTKTLAQLGS